MEIPHPFWPVAWKQCDPWWGIYSLHSKRSASYRAGRRGSCSGPPSSWSSDSLPRSLLVSIWWWWLLAGWPLRQARAASHIVPTIASPPERRKIRGEMSDGLDDLFLANAPPDTIHLSCASKIATFSKSSCRAFEVFVPSPFRGLFSKTLTFQSILLFCRIASVSSVRSSFRTHAPQVVHSSSNPLCEILLIPMMPLRHQLLWQSLEKAHGLKWASIHSFQHPNVTKVALKCQYITKAAQDNNATMQCAYFLDSKWLCVWFAYVWKTSIWFLYFGKNTLLYKLCITIC